MALEIIITALLIASASYILYKDFKKKKKNLGCNCTSHNCSSCPKVNLSILKKNK